MRHQRATSWGSSDRVLTRELGVHGWANGDDRGRANTGGSGEPDARGLTVEKGCDCREVNSAPRGARGERTFGERSSDGSRSRGRPETELYKQPGLAVRPIPPNGRGFVCERNRDHSDVRPTDDPRYDALYSPRGSPIVTRGLAGMEQTICATQKLSKSVMGEVSRLTYGRDSEVFEGLIDSSIPLVDGGVPAERDKPTL